jgi:hypothetical protein
LLQRGDHGRSGGVSHECKCVGLRKYSDGWQNSLELFKGPVEIRRPGD